MIAKLRHILGLQTAEEKLEEYALLKGELSDINDRTDILAEDYVTKLNGFNDILKSESYGTEIKERVQKRYTHFLQEQKKEVIGLVNRRHKIEKSITSILKDEKIKDAVNEFELLEKAKSNYKDGNISKNVYNDIIKAKKGKVHYSDNFVFWNGKLLLIQRVTDDDGANKWGVPGGHVDAGESHEDAAVRELQEETGLVVDKVVLAGTYSNDDVMIEYYTSHIESYTEPQLILDTAEHQSYRWIDLYRENIDEFEFPFNMKENIKKLLLPKEEKPQDISKAVNLFIDGFISKEVLSDIVKARSGVYENTPENRKLGRVGQKYGSKKEAEKNIPTAKKQNIDRTDFHNMSKQEFEEVLGSTELKDGESYFLRFTANPVLDKERGASYHFTDFSSIKEAEEEYPDKEFEEINGTVAEVLDGLAAFDMGEDDYEDVSDSVEEFIKNNKGQDANAAIFYNRVPVLYRGKYIDDIPDGSIFRPTGIVRRFGYEEMIEDAKSEGKTKDNTSIEKATTEWESWEEIEKAEGEETPTNGTIKTSTREGKKAMVWMDGKWHHFGDSSMKHNYSDEAREAATARHKKNLEGSDARSKAFRVYWNKYWKKGGSVKNTESTIEKAFELGLISQDVLEKARSGIYENTPENRKLGRVGQKYGSKKETEKKDDSVSKEDREKNFKAWFGNSKVVDNNGNPLVVYHGTNVNISEFKLSQSVGTHNEKDQLEGIYFTDSRDGANWFALKEDDPRFLKSVYLSIKNPFRAKDIRELKEKLNVEESKGIKDKLIKLGYDGLIVDEGFQAGGEHKLFLAFSPDQIKSATDNEGTFDPKSNDITKSLTSLFEQGLISKDVLEKARTGKYADTSENRRLKRVGQPYGSKKGEDTKETKEPSKQEETANKEGKDITIDQHARESSETALQEAAKGGDEELRVAAKKELERREKEENSSDQPEKENVSVDAEKKPGEEKSPVSEKGKDDYDYDYYTSIKELENKIRELRSADIDYSDEKAMEENTKQVQEAMKERQRLVSERDSLRKVGFEEYMDGFKNFSEAKFKEINEFYTGEAKEIDKYLSKNPEISASIDSYVGSGHHKIREILTKNEDTSIDGDLKEARERLQEISKEIDDKNKDLPFGKRLRLKKENKEFVELQEKISKNSPLERIENLSKFIQDNKISENLTLNRRIKGDGINFFRSLEKGDVYEDKSFSSTSLTELTHFGDFNISILAKKGSSVANINNPSETEYLIDKGAKFRVLEKRDENIIVELL